MSILFQLFRANDLRALAEEGKFPEFKTKIQDAMRISPDASLRLAVATTLKSHWEDARRELQLSSSRIQVDRLTEVLRERARVVFEQLMQREVEPQPSGDLNLENDDILTELLADQDIATLNENAQLKEIFEIAISCELSYFKSSSFFDHIRRLALNEFKESLNGQEPGGPDSKYQVWAEKDI